MKNQITIAKPDSSRSCHHCRHAAFPADVVTCNWHHKTVLSSEANTCTSYRDTRRTSQVISASGKVFD